LEVSYTSADFEKLFSSWHLFLDRLDELGIMDAPSWKHIVDGKQLSKALGVKAGIWMKEALNVSLAWSFRNPGITDPAEAIDEVRQRAEELQIPIVENGRIQ
jgi:tRNA nucleotidyltransferase (CCA-adding enzyme)